MAINKATPRPVQEGIKDSSVRAIPLEREASPQHLPVFPVQTQKGPLRTLFTTGTAMYSTYGSKTFLETEKWFSHQTAALVETVSGGQMIGVRRLVNTDAAAGGRCLAIEIVDDTFPEYQLTSDGQWVLDVNGDPVANGAETIDGVSVRLVLLDVTAANYRTQTTSTGTLAGARGTSTIYPLISAIGEVGDDSNNTGMRISHPNLLSADPANAFVSEDQDSNLYRWQWVKRENARSAAELIHTLTLSRAVDFSTKAGALNTKTNRSYEKELILSEYERSGVGIIPVPGPVEDVHFYDANIQTVLDRLFTVETDAREDASIEMPYDSEHQMSILNAVDFAGVPFFGVRMADDGDLTVEADGVTVFWLTGGSDGTVSEATLDTLTRGWLRGDWDNPDEPLNDWAQFPFSQLYDTGFSLETKYAFIEAVGKRQDIKVDICTQDLSQPTNAIADEVSVGTTLRSYALGIPESVIHGTATCRVSIWGSVGEWANSVQKRRVPLMLDIIRKRAKYMGAGDGAMKSEFAFDDRTRNSVSAVINPSHTYLSMGLKDQYWDLGINYVQYRDRSDLFWPAYQTVYSDDTSVLNSDILTSALVNIKKNMNYHWAINTGDSRLTKDQFAERSDEDFGDLVENKYDDRFDLTWATVFTPDDSIRGYSWTLDVEAASDPSRTVGQYNLTATRPE